MEQYIIEGGIPLNGEVTIGGAKNAALGIIAGAVMADEDVLIENIPNVNDILYKSSEASISEFESKYFCYYVQLFQEEGALA